MKSYLEYLFESDKKYGFRVKLAVDEVSKQHMEKIRMCAGKWKLEAISEPKSLPIAEEHTGFAHLKNCAVNIIDMVMDYPCTPNEVQIAIHEATGIPLSHIMVLTPQQEVLAAPIVQEEDAPILTSPYPDEKSPQLLADLANALKFKSMEMPFAVKPDMNIKTSNDYAQSNQGPLTKQNKIPDPYAGRI
jgi:hypothetical protein